MPYALRRGLGATSLWSGPCSLFNFGVFRPECWCNDFPSLCSKDNYVASVGIVNPDLVYPPMPAPRGAPAGQPVTLDPCAGKIGVDYYACAVTMPADLAAQQNAADKRATQQYFTEVAANLDSVGRSYDEQTGGPFKLSPWAVVGITAGVLALAAIGSGSPRRYGR